MRNRRFDFEAGKFATDHFFRADLDIDAHKIGANQGCNYYCGAGAVYKRSPIAGRSNEISRRSYGNFFFLLLHWYVAACKEKKRIVNLWCGRVRPTVFVRASGTAINARSVRPTWLRATKMVAKVCVGQRGENYDVISLERCGRFHRAHGRAAPLDLSKLPAYSQLLCETPRICRW